MLSQPRMRFAGLVVLTITAAVAIQARAQLAPGGWPVLGGDARHTGMSNLVGPAGSPVQVAMLSGEAAYRAQPAMDADNNVYTSMSGVPNPAGPPNPPLSGFMKVSRNPDNTLQVHWLYPVSSGGTAAIGANGIVYLSGGSNGGVLALNTADGALVWQFSTAGQVNGGIALGPDGTVYAADDIGGDRNPGTLYALDGASGALKWSFATGRGVECSPAFSPSGGTLYLTSTDGNLYALNPASGQLVWKKRCGAMLLNSPSVDSAGNIYVVLENEVVLAVTPSGGSKWSYSMKKDSWRYSRSTPTIDESRGVIYAGGPDGVYAIRMANGTLKWKRPQATTANGCFPIDGRDGRVFVASREQDGFQMLNPDTGAMEFQLSGPGGTPYDFVWGAPAIGSDGSIWINGVESSGLRCFMR